MAFLLPLIPRKKITDFKLLRLIPHLLQVVCYICSRISSTHIHAVEHVQKNKFDPSYICAELASYRTCNYILYKPEDFFTHTLFYRWNSCRIRRCRIATPIQKPQNSLQATKMKTPRKGVRRINLKECNTRSVRPQIWMKTLRVGGMGIVGHILALSLVEARVGS